MRVTKSSTTARLDAEAKSLAEAMGQAEDRADSLEAAASDLDGSRLQGEGYSAARDLVNDVCVPALRATYLAMEALSRADAADSVQVSALPAGYPDADVLDQAALVEERDRWWRMAEEQAEQADSLERTAAGLETQARVSLSPSVSLVARSCRSLASSCRDAANTDRAMGDDIQSRVQALADYDAWGATAYEDATSKASGALAAAGASISSVAAGASVGDLDLSWADEAEEAYIASVRDRIYHDGQVDQGYLGKLMAKDASQWSAEECVGYCLAIGEMYSDVCAEGDDPKCKDKREAGERALSMVVTSLYGAPEVFAEEGEGADAKRVVVRRMKDGMDHVAEVAREEGVEGGGEWATRWVSDLVRNASSVYQRAERTQNEEDWKNPDMSVSFTCSKGNVVTNFTNCLSGREYDNGAVDRDKLVTKLVGSDMPDGSGSLWQLDEESLCFVTGGICSSKDDARETYSFLAASEILRSGKSDSDNAAFDLLKDDYGFDVFHPNIDEALPKSLKKLFGADSVESFTSDFFDGILGASVFGAFENTKELVEYLAVQHFYDVRNAEQDRLDESLRGAGEGLPDGDYSGCSYSLNVDGSVTKHE
ncbi:MAG: hypothetical protein WAY93_06115 [Atopobiaceae bacterium]|jgi:hypothetical protein|nr:hypothetical protein [Atopobiaceae bacterium]